MIDGNLGLGSKAVAVTARVRHTASKDQVVRVMALSALVENLTIQRLEGVEGSLKNGNAKKEVRLGLRNIIFELETSTLESLSFIGIAEITKSPGTCALRARIQC